MEGRNTDPLGALALVLFAATAATAEPDPVAKQLDALHKAARCDDEATRSPWCIATIFVAVGTAGELPKNTVWFGVELVLKNGKSAADALKKPIRPVMFVVDGKGAVALTRVEPEDEGERDALAYLTRDLTAELTSQRTHSKVPNWLAVRAQKQVGKHTPTKSTSEWTWRGTNPTRARKLGDRWVVLETMKDGLSVSVLSDQWR